MTTTPDPQEIAADFVDYAEALDAAVDDTLDELARCSSNRARAWVNLYEHLARDVTAEQKDKILAAALIQIARYHGRRV